MINIQINWDEIIYNWKKYKIEKKWCPLCGMEWLHNCILRRYDFPDFIKLNNKEIIDADRTCLRDNVDPIKVRGMVCNCKKCRIIS